VTAEIGGAVSVVDVAKKAVIGTVKLEKEGARPKGVVVHPDGKRVYVSTGSGNEVATIDAEALRVKGYTPVGRRPWGLAVTSDGRWLLTANGVSEDVSIIDTETEKVVATVPAGKGAWGVVVGR
jgi:YVTN family beta-propeller protein